MLRILLICIGWFFFALACLGAVLPILPTTPFLLLAVACFSRSSPRFHYWLLHRSWFGLYLRCWYQHKSLPKGAKLKSILMIILTFALSMWLVKLLWVRILLLSIMLVLLFFMFRLPVLKNSQLEQKTED